LKCELTAFRCLACVHGPDDTEAYNQGTGRSGKDGKPALALLLEHGRHNHCADKEMLEYQKIKTIC